MKKTKTILLSLVALGVAATAHAGDLKAPFELESTNVLPRKVRNPRFKNLFMSVNEKFNGIGQAEPLGNKLNKTVSWKDVIDAQTTETDKNLLRSQLQQKGIDENGSPGNTTGQINTFANVMVPVFAMGVTDRLTMAVAVPVMKVDARTDTGFVSADGPNSGQALLTQLENDPVKQQEISQKLNNAINQKLATNGYEPISSKTISAVGDIKVVGKYLLHDDGRNAIGVKGEVTTPTGIKPNADKALDIPTGDGQWDVGAALVMERRLNNRLRLIGYGGYTAQLPDQLERRLPKSHTDSISKDKELVDRNLGDIISTGGNVAYEFPSTGLTLGTGYSFQYLTKTTYKNGIFEENRYRLLENEYPCQAVHAAMVTAGFSSVDFYKQKKFVLPFQANVAYSRPFAGRNVTTNSVIAAELVLFF